MKRWVLLPLFTCCIAVGQVHAQKLTDYAKQKKVEMAEKIRIEQQAYEDACKKNTKNSYQGYLQKYPNGKFSSEVKDRLKDYELWEEAKKTNTIAAFNWYKQRSKYNFFVKDADSEIKKLEAIAEWNKIKGSVSIQDVKAYISKYPTSPSNTEAKKKLHELQGVEYYKQNNLAKAYDEFVAAGGRYAIAYNNRNAFDICEEQVSYSKLNEYSSEETLQAFIKEHPSSNHLSTVSNMLAIKKAKNFTMWSTSISFNDALKYATDERTRTIVNSYKESSERQYKEYKRRNRRIQHNRNGNLFQVGIELTDFGYNPTSSEETSATVWYYNFGLSLKVGNYADPVQFEIGAKLGWVGYRYFDYTYYDYGYGYDYGYETEEKETKFHLPLYARLKINLAGKTCKWYIAGVGYYNAVREKYIENEFAIAAGTGWAWKHWDWAFYYKTDLNNKYNLKNDYITTSLSYYF